MFTAGLSGATVVIGTSRALYLLETFSGNDLVCVVLYKTNCVSRFKSYKSRNYNTKKI